MHADRLPLSRNGEIDKKRMPPEPVPASAAAARSHRDPRAEELPGSGMEPLGMEWTFPDLSGIIEAAAKRGVRAMKVLNFGSLNLDYVYQVGHFVQPGETLGALSQTVSPGGKGLNQSVALARAGAEVFHAGCLGRGGEMLGELLEQSGVDTRFLCPVEEIQGNAVIQVDREGQNCILLFGGSNRCVTAEQIENTLSRFSKGDWLVLQNEISMLPEIVDAAFARGLEIVLNPSPWDEQLRAVDFGKIRWMLVNEVEAAQLSGSGSVEKTWQMLHGKYPQMRLLVTLGSEGSIAFTEEETVWQDAFPVKATDTTGAGDTYTGYFVAGRVEGRGLRDCMRRATMAAAISVTRPGAALSIPRREEVEQALGGTGKENGQKRSG